MSYYKPEEKYHGDESGLNCIIQEVVEVEGEIAADGDKGFIKCQQLEQEY